jgi:alanine racemase
MNAASSGAGLRLTIDLRALVRNWQRLAAMIAPAECAAVVKADAYGTVIEQTVPALRDAGCRTFFVAYASEGVRARKMAADADIYVLSGFDPPAAEHYQAAALRPVLNSTSDVEFWAAAHIAAPAALHVDTGMNRLGMERLDTAAIEEARDGVELSLAMSHLACADEPEHSLTKRNCSASPPSASCFGPSRFHSRIRREFILDPSYHFDMARPGIAIYGGASHPDTRSEAAVTAEARILQVRTGRKGETVGYGAARQLERNSRIAVVAAGYATAICARRAIATANPVGKRGWMATFCRSSAGFRWTSSPWTPPIFRPTRPTERMGRAFRIESPHRCGGRGGRNDCL